MSIRTELMKKDEMVKKEQVQEKENFEEKDFIENFLIPKFREIKEKLPNVAYLKISFNKCGFCFMFKTNIDDWENSKFNYTIVSNAVKLAENYDIIASENYDKEFHDTDITFCLFLENINLKGDC